MKKSWINYPVIFGLCFALIALRTVYNLVLAIINNNMDLKKLVVMLLVVTLLSIISWLFIRIGLENRENDV
tara:strand:- start:84806 stop:85018 length:213 start_codon:yes stop_codon:yes gene_type:complete